MVKLRPGVTQRDEGKTKGHLAVFGPVKPSGPKMREGRPGERNDGLSATAIEIEGPLEGGVAGGADKSGSFEDGGHALRRMDESAKRVSP